MEKYDYLPSANGYEKMTINVDHYKVKLYLAWAEMCGLWNVSFKSLRPFYFDQICNLNVFFNNAPLLYSIWPLIVCELHIILKLRDCEIGEHSSFSNYWTIIFLRGLWKIAPAFRVRCLKTRLIGRTNMIFLISKFQGWLKKFRQ